MSGARATRCSSLIEPSWTGVKAREEDMAKRRTERRGAEVGGYWWWSEGERAGPRLKTSKGDPKGSDRVEGRCVSLARPLLSVSR